MVAVLFEVTLPSAVVAVAAGGGSVDSTGRVVGSLGLSFILRGDGFILFLLLGQQRPGSGLKGLGEPLYGHGGVW